MNGITTQKQEAIKKLRQVCTALRWHLKREGKSGNRFCRITRLWTAIIMDDGNSRYYNQLANTKQVQKDWNSAEDLMAQAPQYNYGLVLDYNSECTPGKGSAIFLHCPKSWNNAGTSDASVFRRKI